MCKLVIDRFSWQRIPNAFFLKAVNFLAPNYMILNLPRGAGATTWAIKKANELQSQSKEVLFVLPTFNRAMELRKNWYPDPLNPRVKIGLTREIKVAGIDQLLSKLHFNYDVIIVDVPKFDQRSWDSLRNYLPYNSPTDFRWIWLRSGPF